MIVKENISFGRGQDPRETMDIGDETYRVLQKMKTIATSLGIDEIPIDDLNREKALASWRMPGIKGTDQERMDTGYGRIILFKSGDEIKMYTKGVKGTDIDQWYSWNSPRKWITNIKMINESISFERGKDPKKSIGLGISSFYDNLSKGDKFRLRKDLYGLGYRRGYLVTIIGNISDSVTANGEPSKWIEGVKITDFDGKEVGNSPTWNIAFDFFKENFFPVMNESVSFERGKDPRHSMGIGNIKEVPSRIYDLFSQYFNGGSIYSIWSTDGHEGYDVPVLVIYTNLGKRELNKYLIENGYDQYIQMPGKIVGKISRDNKIAYPINPEYRDVLKHFSSYEYGRDLMESVNFERGKDLKDTMKIGAKELLKSDNLGLQNGWPLQEKERPSSLLGKDPYDVYILGFAGEVDYNEWHFNEFTEMLFNACKKGKILEMKKYGKHVYFLIDTEFGKIVRAHMDEEGLYFYGGLDAALNIGIPDIPQPERESIF